MALVHISTTNTTAGWYCCSSLLSQHMNIACNAVSRYKVLLCMQTDRAPRVWIASFFGYLPMVYYVILSPVVRLPLSYCSTFFSPYWRLWSGFFLLRSFRLCVHLSVAVRQPTWSTHRNIEAETATFNTKRILWNFFGFFFGKVLAIDLLWNNIPLDGACVRVCGACVLFL